MDDAQDGLRLCPWDIRLPNFKKDGEGKNLKAVALNFTGACFLPPSFFAVAMATAGDAFVRNVARRVKYPQSDAVDAMVSAFYVLVFKTNDIGQPDSFFFILVRLTSRLDRSSKTPPPARARATQCEATRPISTRTHIIGQESNKICTSIAPGAAAATHLGKIGVHRICISHTACNLLKSGRVLYVLEAQDMLRRRPRRRSMPPSYRLFSFILPR